MTRAGRRDQGGELRLDVVKRRRLRACVCKGCCAKEQSTWQCQRKLVIARWPIRIYWRLAEGEADDFIASTPISGPANPKMGLNWQLRFSGKVNICGVADKIAFTSGLVWSRASDYDALILAIKIHVENWIIGSRVQFDTRKNETMIY